jgi:ABC-type nitrate/sulfonate/bicarbonate transport system ATPase subunit/ABC-type transporter Mla maintaining outer membrane lipid asymmetry permease subunit MlaE
MGAVTTAGAPDPDALPDSEVETERAPVSSPPPPEAAEAALPLSESLSEDAAEAVPVPAPEAVLADPLAEPVLTVRALEVALPDGTTVVTEVDIELLPGRIISLLGPSGAGKSTLLRALMAPEELQQRGYSVRWEARSLAAEVAFIPQRGALFDHLDVAGNIALAMEAGGKQAEVLPWLAAVDLDASLAEPGTSVATLSGGQAQRLAVARTLAAGRGILVLDEPSVGLDPLGVRKLARLVVKQARERGVAILVITHDLSLAAGVSDTVLFLDPARQRLVPIPSASDGPAELGSEEARQQLIAALDTAASALLAAEAPAAPARRRKATSARGPNPLRIAGAALLHALSPRLARQASVVFVRALRQSLLKPLPFYAVVGLLLGFSVLYVIAKMSADLRAAAMLRLVGGTYILSLAPPLSAILFASTSGNAVNAWLGGMQLNRQILALEGLGVPLPRYLWSPAWTALFLSYLLTVGVFIAAMVGGGFILFLTYGQSDALAILTSDFVDPAPGRGAYLVRGLWLVFAYAIAIATIVVQSGTSPKEEAGHVTASMTSAVIRTTLFVVAMELASVMVLFALQGK